MSQFLNSEDRNLKVLSVFLFLSLFLPLFISQSHSEYSISLLFHFLECQRFILSVHMNILIAHMYVPSMCPVHTEFRERCQIF